MRNEIQRILSIGKKRKEETNRLLRNRQIFDENCYIQIKICHKHHTEPSKTARVSIIFGALIKNSRKNDQVLTYISCVDIQAVLDKKSDDINVAGITGAVQGRLNVVCEKINN